MPQLTINNNLDLNNISRDRGVIENYKNDPLVHNKISIKLGLDILKNGEWILANSNKLGSSSVCSFSNSPFIPPTRTSGSSGFNKSISAEFLFASIAKFAR